MHACKQGLRKHQKVGEVEWGEGKLILQSYHILNTNRHILTCRCVGIGGGGGGQGALARPLSFQKTQYVPSLRWQNVLCLREKCC